MENCNDVLEGLDEGLRSKVKACGSADELRGLAEACGAEFTDEMLVGIAGGDEGGGVADAGDFSGYEEAKLPGIPCFTFRDCD